MVLGFTEQMSDLLAAADVLIHSTGGVTVLEALARGCPVVSYGELPGHLQQTSKDMASLGVVLTAKTPVELESLLQCIVAAGRKEPSNAGATAASFVLARTPRVVPLPAWRVRGVRAAAVLMVGLLVGGWAFSADEPYLLAATAFHLPAVREVPGTVASVGLMIRAPEAVIPQLSTVVAQHGSRASFSLRSVPSRATLQALNATGNEPFAELGSGKLVGWIHTRRALGRETAALGLDGEPYFLAPPDGFSLGQYLLARRAGYEPVRGELTARNTAALKMGPVHEGQILVVTLDKNASVDSQILTQLLTRLDQRGLSVEPVGDLIGGATGDSWGGSWGLGRRSEPGAVA